MYLRRLQLWDYKNHVHTDLQLQLGIQFLLGDNGAGKTNVLEAISLLSTLRSITNKTEAYNIRHGQQLFSVIGQFVASTGQVHEVGVAQKSAGRKQLRIDGNPQGSFSDHIGRFPVVLVSPGDEELIGEGSEERRKMLDAHLSQIVTGYLPSLLQYNHFLDSRNALLKQALDQEAEPDAVLLAHYSQGLINHGMSLFQSRKHYIEQLVPMVSQYYALLGDDREQVSMSYVSGLFQQSFEEGLLASWRKDQVLGRTMFGPHKDDVELFIDGQILKREASQGQRKAFLLSLRFAQFEMSCQALGESPILLLDDVFDKLDDRRIVALVQVLKRLAVQQAYITDSRPERSRQLADSFQDQLNVHFWRVAAGLVQPAT